MSVTIKVARAQSQGGLRGYNAAGGLFGAIGGALKKVAGIAVNVLPGPVGALARTAVQAVSQRSPAVSRGAVMPGIGAIGSASFPVSVPGMIGGGFNMGSLMPGAPGAGNVPYGAPGPGLANAAARLFPGGSTGRGTGCMSGYHPNRTGYYTKSGGWVEPYTKCVRNRRRNPLNPRALDRSMSRLSSAGKALKRLGFKAPSAKGIAQKGKKRGKRR